MVDYQIENRLQLLLSSDAYRARVYLALRKYPSIFRYDTTVHSQNIISRLPLDGEEAPQANCRELYMLCAGW